MDKINPKFQVSLFVMDGEEPFICSVNGAVTIDVLQQFELQIQSQIPSDELNKDGIYSLMVSKFSGQYGEFGRCELEPYWEWNVEKYEPLGSEEEES